MGLNLYKGQGEPPDHGYYRGLNLTDSVMKPLEWMVASSTCQRVNLEEMKFPFVPGRSTTDASQYSEEFGLGVGVHQGSALSPLLCILV